MEFNFKEEVINEKVPFEQRPEGAWGQAMHIWKKKVPDIGDSKDKRSSMTMCLYIRKQARSPVWLEQSEERRREMFMGMCAVEESKRWENWLC